MSQPTQIPLCDYGRFSRLHELSVSAERLSIRETMILAVAGAAAAAAVAFLPMQLRIPGHAILKATLPIVCGIALVPRPLAGTIAGSAAMFSSAIFLLMGVGHLPAAAMASLIAIGPAIDVALRGAKPDSASLYLRFAVAGLLANLCAFVVRWGTALLQADHWQSLNFRQMGLWALVSFAICGLAAGLLSGVVCFRSSLRTENTQ